MCLSRAAGSRPGQPAMTSWSIGTVNGVVVSCASMVKVRSNTDDVLHARRQFEYPAICATRRGEHQSDRHLAFAMRRQRDRTAIDHVDQRAIAQRKDIGGG